MKKIQNKKLIMTVTNYPIGDFMIRLKNSANAGQKSLEVASTKLINAVAKTLKDMGYISEINKDGSTLKVNLAYKNKMPILSDIVLVSKPSRRVYMSSEEVQSIRSPYSLVLTTTSGVMSSEQAIKKNLGGEVLAKIL